MLIASPRHRARDLELWAETAEADLLHWPRLRDSGKVQRSLAAIREFAANCAAIDPRRPFYVGVSWGKDSVVAFALCLAAELSPDSINLRCTNRNPDCDAVRDAFFERFPGSLRHHREVPVDYEDLHAAKSDLPDVELDKRTDERWYSAIRETSRPYGGRHLLGIRADESRGRTIRCCRWGISSPNACAPLAWWTEQDVFAYLAYFDLPIHPAYAMLGGGRWPRERIRTAEIGDTRGKGGGRAQWEREYYGDVLNRMAAGATKPR